MIGVVLTTVGLNTRQIHLCIVASCFIKHEFVYHKMRKKEREKTVKIKNTYTHIVNSNCVFISHGKWARGLIAFSHLREEKRNTLCLTHTHSVCHTLALIPKNNKMKQRKKRKNPSYRLLLHFDNTWNF